jgi:hypothetical protein
MEAQEASHRHAGGPDLLIDPITLRDPVPTGQETPA